MNIFRSILSILILFIPLYPKFPLTNFQNTYVALRLDDIVVALFFLIWFVYQIKNRFPVFKEKITLLFIAYFLAITVSTITSILIYKTDSLNILLLHLFRRFEYISLFFITQQAIKTKKDFFYPYIFLLLAMTGIAIYGYGQKYLHFPIISTMNEEFSKGQLLRMDVWTRISSTFAGHYDLAAYLSLVLIIILGFIVISQKLFIRLPSLIIFLVGFNLLTLTASRISIFAFWGGAFISLLLIRKYLWIIPLSALVIYSLISSGDLNKRLIATISTIRPVSRPTAVPTKVIVPTPVPVIVTTAPVIIKVTPRPPTPTIFRHAPEDIFIPIDTDVGVARSGEIRFNVEWPRAITAFTKNPLVGTGLGSISLATDNDYLRLLGESGLLGFLTFLVPIFYLLIRSLRLIRVKKLNYLQSWELIFFGVLCSSLANAIFIDIFEASKVAYTFWIIFAIYYQCLKLNESS